MSIYYSEEEQKRFCVVDTEFTVDKRSYTDLTAANRFISLVLRHKPEAAGIALDPQGWAKVEELLAGMKPKHPIDMEALELIVRTDEKQRYSFNEDKSLIRANQGHSVNVDVELERAEPPKYLWHGTAEKYVESINTNGLISKSRLYVHLSQDVATAKKVGERHGKVVIYRVNALQMHKQGIEFFISANQVWLTKQAPKEFIEIVEITEELSE